MTADIRTDTDTDTDANTDTDTAPGKTAWRILFVVLVVVALVFVGTSLRKYVAPSTDATASNEAAAAVDSSCLPGRQVTILDFPHVSLSDAKSVEYNSNPPTSGAHYGAALAPGIYGEYLAPGLTVHAMEHGRVIIHYRPDTPAATVKDLERIARSFARDTVLHPNPELDTQFALTAWGRIDTFDTYDHDRVVEFVDRLRNRYNHKSTIRPDECAVG